MTSAQNVRYDATLFRIAMRRMALALLYFNGPVTPILINIARGRKPAAGVA